MDWNSLGALAISVVIALALAFPLARPLRLHSGVFYVLACVVVGVYVWLVVSRVNLNAWRMLTFVLQKGYLSSALLGIVMFTGCLDDASPLKCRLRPVRGELSVLSFIFILGHLAVFLPSYASRLVAGSVLKTNALVSIVVALVLTAVFVVLGVTSFKVVRKHMNGKVWKAIQRLAYLVVALYIVHIGFFLGGSAFGGSGKGMASFVVYAVLVALYAVLRVAKAVRDHRRAAAGEEQA
jgi:DMSO/TMAO reductase YedYZ heme-binding membrane subunit